MPDPRQVFSLKFYMISRRCTQRQFWLRPDDELNQIWRYCLAEAASRCHVEVVFTSVMSNHHHTIVIDRHNSLPRVLEFMEHLHKHVAKCVNALRGRWENLWAAEEPSVVELKTPADLMSKLVYAAVNPVAAHLVERVHHWPGVNAFSDFLDDRSTVVSRPRHFFSSEGTMPKSVTLRYAVPPELGDPADVKALFRESVHAAESRLLTERRRRGRCVLGRRAVLRQRCSEQPWTREPRRELKPRVAASSLWTRLGALRGDRAFREAYRAARAAWQQGKPAVFPAGTYWLRRFAGVQVAQGPPE